MKNLLPLLLAFCLIPAVACAQENISAVSVIAEAPESQPSSPSIERQRILAFQVALNQLADQSRLRPLQAAKLRRAAKDAALCEYLAIRYGSELDEVASEVAAGDQFFAFIKFIIANQESILKFVTMLIDLFS
jgi:hypothetical protein